MSVFSETRLSEEDQPTEVVVVLYTHNHNNTTKKKDERRFFIKLRTSHFICNVCMWEGVEDRTETAIFWPPILWPSALCLSPSPDAQPEAMRWLSLLHLISIFSGPQFIRAPRPLRPDVAFRTPLVYNSVSNSNFNCNLTSVLTELYNCSTPTRSSTRSLEWYDWSSSSGNNSHAVHRSLSSGASVYECTMELFFNSSHFISQFPPTRFPLITAIRMCHFLPVHHLGMAFLAGSKAKIQQ